RGVAHLEPLIATGELAKYRDRSGADPMLSFRAAANHMAGIHADAGPDAVTRYKAIREQERAVFRRLIPVLAARGRGEERLFVGMVLRDLPPAERFEQLGALIDELAVGPRARSRAVEYVRGGYTVIRDADTPGFKALVDRLAKSPNPDLRGAADLRAVAERGTRSASCT
ncbi:MAG: hypothetical protein J0H65_03315, partial [Rhizobiales bacterium]|nr:hypothetical protein [Hyphomicrobiales bacterium]